MRATTASAVAVRTWQERVQDSSTKVVKSMALVAAATAGMALVGGLAIAGLALGVIGAGVAIAAKNEQVKASFTAMGDHVKKRLTEMAAPFIPVLTEIASKITTTFDKISGPLSNMFAKAAPMLGKFVDGLLRLVENVMPGLSAGIDAASPVIDALSNGLAGLGGAIGGFFQNMTTGAAGGASAINQLFNAINWLLPALGSAIGFAAQYSDVLIPLALAIGGVALVVKAVTAATSAWAAIQAVVRAATVVWTGVQWLLNAALTANPIGLVIVAVAALVAAIVWVATQTTWFQDLWNVVWGGIQAAAGAVIDWLVDAFWWLAQKSQAMGEGIENAFSTVADAIKGAFRSAFNAIANLWNSTVGRLSWTVPDWVPGIGGSTLSAPKIPTFHTGGRVPGAPGEEMVALLQAGERVIPASKADRGSAPIVFGSDGSRLGDAILGLVKEAMSNRGGDPSVLGP